MSARRLGIFFALFLAAPAFAGGNQAQPADNDQTLRAMHDEMERSKTRLVLPGVDRPFYIEYRLLELDVRSVSASFGSLVSSSVTRNRFMSVDVRVGDYHFDSSNFVSDEGFRGFLGSTGQIGIDRDYNSLRQDLWLATDQAYKEATVQLSQKQAFVRSLNRPPEIDDFSQEQSVVLVEPRMEADWTSRNWDAEARAVSAVFRNHPELNATRVQYYLIYATTYLLSSEGTQIRVSRSLAGIEASLATQADDGMSLHNFYSAYVARPGDLPAPDGVEKALEQASQELVALRAAPKSPDYAGPVLFEAPAAASLLAQVLGPSLNGARPPLSMLPLFDQMMQRMGGQNEWSGRVGTRVLPTDVSLSDDPAMKDFRGTPLIGGFDVDDEGVRAQRIDLVTGGMLFKLLMSRRPGPEFDHSNGHGRSAFLSDTRPAPSNLIFQSANAMSPQDLKKKFLDLCKSDGHAWCVVVRRMDNPALASQRQGDFGDIIAGLGGGVATGDRLPLLVYRVYVADGREELMRGALINGLDLRTLRSLAGVGNDLTVYPFMQNTALGVAGTALGAFGSIQGGIPSDMIAPSLLLEDVDIRGFHGEARRPPLLPAPPIR